MADLLEITNLSEIATRYDAMLCDAWGVIHNGVALTPEVEDAMVAFRRERGPLIILTNAPRPSSIIPGQLDRLGLSRDAYDGVVTSGDAVRAEITARLPAPAACIGAADDDPLYRDLHIEFTSVAEAEFIICTGIDDAIGPHPDDYREVLRAPATKQAPMICANPDIVVNWGGQTLYCAGAIAQVYADLGGPVIYGGKPHRPIYDLAHRAICAAHGGMVERSRILAVGDGLATDIKGANEQGFDVLFVYNANGINEGEPTFQNARATLAAAGARAIGAAERLIW
ncbi:MAG: TIGR01459 family HAD-type hydrolase [Pseudomonadota bacterium]